MGLVLAAGAGRRYGEPKAAVLWQGERFVDRSIRLLHQAGCEEVVVVLGAWVAPLERCRAIVNPQWDGFIVALWTCCHGRDQHGCPSRSPKGRDHPG